jgi:colanic acid biosynthesis glycosyl transferase WcaI
MKVLFLSQYFYPEQFSNNAIAQELVKRGHDVTAVPCVPNYPAGQFFEGYSNRDKRSEVWNGVHIHRAFTVARGTRALQMVLNYLVYPFSAAFTIFRRVPEKQDVSFVSMPSPLTQALAGILYRWRTGTPCIYWVQDLWPESALLTLKIKNRFARSILTALCGWLYRQADLILVQSDAFPKIIEQHGVDPEKIKVLPNTAPDLYHPEEREASPEIAKLMPQSGFRLMFAGNIGESQDFDTLIAAADLLRDEAELTWIILGSGRDEARVREKVVTMGLAEQFQFLGRHPEEQMPHFFAHADAMLVSLKDNPIFALTVPYKVQCYMACGKPIVAALNGEGARIIENSGAGVVAQASDSVALALAIRKMIGKEYEQIEAYAKASLNYFQLTYRQEIVYDILESSMITMVDKSS